MTTFNDEFDRANGPLGANWTVTEGDVHIASLNAVSTSSGIAVTANPIGSGDQDVTIEGASVPYTGHIYYVLVKASANGANYYYAIFDNGEGGNVRLYRVTNYNSWIELGRSGNFGTSYGGHTLRLTYSGGTLTGYRNGVSVVTASDSTYAANEYAGIGIGSNQVIVYYFHATGSAARSMVVTPDPLWVGGGQQIMTATGTGTTWTPGAPGSTTITCDHGTVDLQEVVSATEVQFLYTPEEYIGTLTFTESDYGLTDTVDAVAVMPEDYPTLDCRLTALGAALINDTASEAPLSKRLFARNSYIGTAPIDVTYGEVVKWLGDFLINNGWSSLPAPTATFQVLHELLNGGYDPTPGVNVLGQLNTLISDLADHAQQLADVQGPGGVTMATLAAALSDLRGLGSPSIADVLTAVQDSDSTEVLNYLSAMRGNEVVTLLQVVTALTNIQTLNGYDLGTIVQRLDDRPTTLYMDAAFALTNGALGGLALEIAGLYKALGVVEATNIFDVISGIVGDLFSGLGSTLVDNFLDSIFGPESPLPQVVLVPPIWPGLNRANVGNAVALANGQTIAGPLHGLLFTIDGYPAEKYGYHFGSVTSWGRVGSVIFATDRGDYERSQTFAIDTQVLCPQQMAIADHAIIKVNTGWSGTVRPWTIAQPSGGG